MKKIFLLAALILISFSTAGSSDYPNDPEYRWAEKEPLKHPLFTEQTDWFGFAPKFSSSTAIYKKHPFDSQLVGKPQISGSSIDKAWEIEKGDPSVIIGVLECGMLWNDIDAIYKLYLNKGELAKYAPAYDGEAPIWDTNGDARFSVEDYEPQAKEIIDTGKVVDKVKIVTVKYHFTSGGFNGNPRFFKSSGGKVVFFNDPNRNGLLDPQDLIRAFSDGVDDDGNGFTDDICGWDFFDDDNDPEDSSSTALSQGHGAGEVRMCSAKTNNNFQAAGICPECTPMIVRAWDSFAADTAYFGLAALYAANQGATVILGAIGGLNNTGICRDVFRHIYNEKGAALVMVGSDLNTANHNWPTHLNESMYTSGVCGDTYIIPDLYNGFSLPPFTYFRHSNNCQFGGKNMIVMAAPQGSQSTGYASGAAALLQSYARRNSIPLHPDQVKQLMCMWAEDVLPENTKGIGDADEVKPGWDQHTAYGRVHMGRSMTALRDGKLPHIARFTSPVWYAYLNPDRDRLSLYGEVIPAKGSSGVTWTVEAGYGIEPDKFIQIASGTATGNNVKLADVDLRQIDKSIFKANNVDIMTFPSTPETKNAWEAGIQPNRNMFTVRLTVTDGNRETRAEDRRAFFLCADPSVHPGWPRYMDSGGEQSPRLADLDGDNMMEVIVGTSDGRLLIFRHDGEPYTYNGKAVWFKANTSQIAAGHGMSVPGADMTQPFNTPAVGDIDGDGVKEIVVVSGSVVYCFRADGRMQSGFPQDFSANFRNDLKLGRVTHLNSIGPGVHCGAVLHDLNGDGKKEIILGAADGRIYAWDCWGRSIPGWPVLVRTSDTYGGRIIHAPCMADLDGDGRMEIVVTTNEARPKDMESMLVELLDKIKPDLGVIDKTLLPAVITLVTNVAGKEAFVYAIRPEGARNGDGGRNIDKTAFVKGWPAGVMVLLADLLPQVCPSHKAAAYDYDGDGKDEVVASFISSKTVIIDGDGKVAKEMMLGPVGDKAVGLFDKTLPMNAFSNPVIGDITGDGSPEIINGGVTFMFAVNLFLLGQNIPFNHIIQAWDPKTGKFLESYPRAIDDFIYSDQCIADVSGDGRPEIIAGTGLYLLHAFGSNGYDAPGFPKMSGGWLMPAASVEDIDDDGMYEIAAVTREGFIFVWDTKGRPSAYPTWMTDGHDNFCTSNIGTDAAPPAAVTDIAQTDGGIKFKCPGDDGWFGKAAAVAIYGYSERITSDNLNKATLVMNIVPVQGGKELFAKLDKSFPFYAVVATDKAGNSSQLVLPQPISVTPESGEEEKDTWCFARTALS